MTSRFDWQTSISVHLRYFSQEYMEDFQRNNVHFAEMTTAYLEETDNFSEVSKKIFKMANEHDVKIRSFHLPFAYLDPASFDKEHRAFYLKHIGELVRISADRGAEIAVIHPSSEPYADENRDVQLDIAIDTLSQINDIAISSGIKLAIENLPRTCFCRDVTEIKKISKDIPTAFFTFDSNHSLIDSNTDIIKAMGEKIIALHISDYEFIDEMHLLPGEGKVDWAEIMACLEKANYSGTWNYEVSTQQPYPASVFKENHKKLLTL